MQTRIMSLCLTDDWMKQVMNFADTSYLGTRLARLRAGLFAMLLLSATGQTGAQEIAGITPPGGAKPIQLGTGLGMADGPAQHADGSVYFSDLVNDKISIWMPDGKVKDFRDKCGRCNGLAFDAQQRLVACEMNNGRLSVTGPDGKPIPLVAMYQGKPFNQTNDLVIDAKGGIYFTDPYFGPERSLPQDRMAVYYLPPGAQAAERVAERGPEKPTGVFLSPDNKTLYVVDAQKPIVWSYVVADNGKLEPAGTVPETKGHFATLKLPDGKTEGGGDGGAVDANGNVYIATELGIQVFSPAGGAPLGIIAIPEPPSNCAFFGPENKSLFVTAKSSIYKVDLLVPGRKMANGK